MPWGYNDKGEYGWFEEPGQAPPPGQGGPPPGGSPPPQGGGILDLLVVNWEDGSNARYDVSRMQSNGDGTYSYGGYRFDDEGRPLSAGVPGDGPGQWVNGKPGARGGTGPSGGGGGGGGYGGYGGQLASLLKAQGAADLANTKSALQQALIAFGLVPEGFQDKLGVLDDLTKDLIAKNTSSGISTYARLQDMKKQSIRGLTNRLSSQGLRRSGARGAGLRRGQLDWDRGFQDSLSQLLSHTGSLYNQYAGNEFARQMQLMQNMFTGPPSNPYGPSNNNNSFTPAWQGTWAEGVDTGGYVPDSGVITDPNAWKPPEQTYNPGGGSHVAY